ncbi:hypothetical protein VTN96DRAFT_2650 [Rasamsonia emersonii]
MTQGAIKKPSKKSTSSSSSQHGPKRGARVIAPKKATLIKKHKMNKKLSAGLIEKTERTLAERAGHLEMLANERKEKQKEKLRKWEREHQKKKSGA